VIVAGRIAPSPANPLAPAVENMREYENIDRLLTQLERENGYLREEIFAQRELEDIIGTAPASVRDAIDHAASSDAPVLIVGEVGTGKERVARAIHARSARQKRLLVKADCAAIGARLIDRELFGCVEDPSGPRPGRFELADMGTIFLDEIGELPVETQITLLDVLQQRRVEPIDSGGQTVSVDARVIAATSRNLEREVAMGKFRADLYVGLNVVPIRVPPLRERRADIPQLVSFFIERHAKRIGRTIEGVKADGLERLTRYAWPGNVRELETVIVRALVLSEDGVLDLSPDVLAASSAIDAAANSATESLQPYAGSSTLEDVERAHILAVLAQTGWVIEGSRGAAKILGMHPNTLRSRMKKLGVERARQKSASPPAVEGV
jgi:formate hydrogenlyase transcriptional activator